MAKDFYQNTKTNQKTDSNERRRRNKKTGNRIIGIAALGLLLAACGAPSEEQKKRSKLLKERKNRESGQRSMRAARCRSLADICMIMFP